VKYYFIHSAAPYAYQVYDVGTKTQVVGTVYDEPGGRYSYRRGRWDGNKQVFDILYAATAPELSDKIDKLLNG
jgi:hypothetical protein